MLDHGTARRSAAFTLIELLVVIAIVAALASMLLPAVGALRARAKQLTCLNNQRQMMMAVIAYSLENEGRTPPTESQGGGWGNVARSTLLMLMYWDFIPTDALTAPPFVHAGMWWQANWRWPNSFSCPSVNPGRPTWSDWAFTARWGGGPASERWLSDGSAMLDTLSPTTPYLAETCSSSNPVSGGGYWAAWNSVGPRLTHQRRANVSFPDGHTAARSKDQLVKEDGVTFTIWSPP